MKKILPTLLFSFSIAICFAQSGLVAYYPFTGNVADSSGFHHDGTITGGVTLTSDRFGNPNSAYHFDGSSGYIKCPNDSELLKSKSISFSVWFRVENRAGGWDQNVILANVGSYLTSGGFELFTSNPPGVYKSDFRNQTHNDQYLQGNDSIWPEIWYNLVIVIRHDSVPDSTTVINYFNGAVDDSTRTPGSIVYNNITMLYIGANRDISCCQRYFLGDIDEVKIFKRALSPSEVTSLLTGVKIENMITQQPNLFPNPSDGSFTIDNLPGEGKTDVDVVNLTGQVVFSRQINSSEKRKLQVDLPDLVPGLYIVRIKTGAGVLQMKWAKE